MTAIAGSTPATTTATTTAPTVRTRRVVPLLAVAAVLLTFTALSGLGDLPAPFDEAAKMSTYFETIRSDVFVAAPMGILGAAAMAAFVLAVAGWLRTSGQSAAATAVASGGLLAAGYLLAIQVAYVSLAYLVAATSPEATKALFVSTIVALPVVGLATAVTLAGAAYGASRARLLPRWWSIVSLVGAAFAAIAIFSYADEGFFSPDVQQQTVAGALNLWLLLTAVALIVRNRRAERQS